jgi:hypothetical protein
MNWRKRFLAGVILLCFCLGGCMSASVPKPLPKAAEAVQIEKFFPIPLEAAWDRALAFASADGMKIITHDKPSGLITFVSNTTKVYYNMLLRPSTTGSGTMGYVYARTPSWTTFDTTILDRLGRSLMD